MKTPAGRNRRIHDDPAIQPREVYRAPRSWGEQNFHHQGGHRAAWEQPELFSAEVRAAFRSLR